MWTLRRRLNRMLCGHAMCSSMKRGERRSRVELSEVDARYLTDDSAYTGWADRVFAPATEAEVVAILGEAVASGTPVTIAGAGSGLTGSRVPQGGWVLSLERFRRLEIEQGF